MICEDPQQETRAMELFDSNCKLPLEVITPLGETPSDEDMTETARILVVFALDCIHHGIVLKEVVIDTFYGEPRSSCLRDDSKGHAPINYSVETVFRQSLRRY
jgi:hypothetical protein